MKKNQHLQTELKIVKRNGDTVPFNKTKIRQAICKAMKNGSGVYMPDIARLIANDADRYFRGKEETPTIFMVEKYVFERLTFYGQSHTAMAYEGYRAVQAYKRENDPLIESVMGLVELTNEEVMSENANKQAVLVATQRDLIAGEVSKAISKNYLIPAHLIQANDNGMIKIHDLDYYLNGIYNCELVNLKDMLDNGTVINKKAIRKPKSLRTAMTVATQIAAQISSNTYGGQTMSLTHMAPYVRTSKEKIAKKYNKLNGLLPQEMIDTLIKDDLTAEIRDSVQTFNYQINTISSTNGCNGHA